MTEDSEIELEERSDNKQPRKKNLMDICGPFAPLMIPGIAEGMNAMTQELEKRKREGTLPKVMPGDPVDPSKFPEHIINGKRRGKRSHRRNAHFPEKI
jgi:hypothetical protein